MYMYIIYIYIYIYIYSIKNMSTSKETIDNPDRRAGGYYFIYPWKFWTKQSFSAENFAKTKKAKNQDHVKLHMIFP